MLSEVCTLLVDDYYEHQGVVFYGSPASIWVREQNGMGFQGDSHMLKKRHWNDMVHRLRKRPCDILITHGPPRAENGGHFFLDRVFFGLHVGCAALSEAIKTLWKEGKAPKFHIFGHIHEGYGSARGLGPDTATDTTFVNAASCTLLYEIKHEPVIFDTLVDKVKSGAVQRKVTAKM